MELAQWQHRYERWLDENHFTDDAAHDIAHFRRVWMTAQGIMADEDSDPLVVLTACYFHDIVSLPKNHRNVATPRGWQREKRARSSVATFLIFRRIVMQPLSMLLKRTASVPVSRRKARRPKLCRMPTGWRR